MAIVPAGTAQASAYELRVETRTPDVRYFGSFTYDTARVTGADPAKARALTRKVQAFTDPWAKQYLRPDRKMTAYLKKAKPAYYGATITSTPDCRSGYICLSQESSFSTPLIAGSITDVQARAWSARSGKAANLAAFVPAGELPAFTRKVKAGIQQAPCYYGFAIDLPAAYKSFPNWVPTSSGIALWFPEYQFGCQVMEVRVDWP
jgi:hypothetical protein